jgi:hypothetical protein
VSVERISHTQPRATSLVDILDRVLDKGLVVAGDIRVSLANVELLTVRIRLLVCSIDKAQEIGLDWWRHDTFFSTQTELAELEELAALRARVETLERQLAAPATVAARPARRAARRQQRGSE